MTEELWNSEKDKEYGYLQSSYLLIPLILSFNHQHDKSGSHEDRKDRKTELPKSKIQNSKISSPSN